MFPDRPPLSTSCFSDRCAIHEIFEEQAALRPDAIAVVNETHELTYRELNSRANQLAYYLMKLGVGCDVPVALFLERSPEMVIGILGILKSGATYVPLDPAYPAQRLAFMLDDSRAPVLLAERRCISRLPAQRAVTIGLDTDWKIIAAESTENPSSQLTAANSACLLYTSGSTGTPKGVEILHGGLLNYVLAAGDYFGLTPADRVLQFSSMSFDAAAEEIFCTLTRGATLVLRNDSMLGSAADFLTTCAKWHITVLDLPTAYWHELTVSVYAERLAIPDRIRLVIIGGERAIPERLTQWHACIGKRIRLYNSYGPAETTIAATICDLTDAPEADDSLGQVPIGRPLPNVQVYVLDPNLNSVSVGVTGELFIGGVGVARGYRERPELTAERFIPDPFSKHPSARLYRTGDLARFRPDGNLEFVGRIDYQVKIRGQRIEMEEIETVLREHLAVRDAVVIAREDPEAGKQLVAYVARSGETTANASQLRSFLDTRLPHYMIPAAFVFLDALPMTPNGKVDRRALPAPDLTRTELEESYAAPRTPVEETLAKIWAEALKIDRVGIHDNFFDLGGHSLLALRILGVVEKTFGRANRLSTLFQAPTVAQFAKLLSQEVASESWSSLLPLQPHGSKLPFFWVHGEASDAFLPRYLGSDQPLYGLMHQGLDGRPITYTSVEDMAIHYLNEIRTIQSKGPYLLGGYCFGGLIAFEMAQQLQKVNEEIALLVTLEPVDLRDCHISEDFPVAEEIGNSSEPGKNSFSGEVHRHLHNLGRLTFKEKVSYISERIHVRIKDRANVITDAIEKNARRAVSQLYLRFGYRLPASYRSQYILGVYGAAMRNYLPRAYSGRLIIFNCAGNTNEPQNWGRLALGGLEVHTVSGNHTDVLTEPSVRVWSKTLSAYIDKAQSQVGSIASTKMVIAG